jgi:hypothetical protein
MTKHIDDPLATETGDDVRFVTDERAPEDGAEHLPSEITYDEQRYPARPTRLRPTSSRTSRGPSGRTTARSRRTASRARPRR